MFLGHYGVAFAAKAIAPRANLSLLVIAAIWLDLVWPVLLLHGVEEVKITPGITAVSPFDFVYYPYSHSLFFAMMWGLLYGRIVWAVTKDGATSFTGGFVVVSHWLLDWIVHRPDLPLFPGADEKAGLGLWNSWPATLTVELLIFGSGLAIYLYVTRAKDWIGQLAVPVLAIVLLAIYAVSLKTTPPNDTIMIALGTLSMVLLAVWAGWGDLHRVPKNQPSEVT